MNLIQHLSKQAFWDVDMQQMDADKHAAFIIEKVFEYGKWSDILIVTKYYGEKIVKDVLKNNRFFLPDTINFISTIFNLNKEEMACYTMKPYHRNAFNS